MLSRTLALNAISFATLVALPVAAQDLHSDCAVRIGSGPKGGVYELIARDIQSVCGNEVSICVLPSSGGLQNLMKLSASEVDVGIAQVDTLQTMARDGDENIRNLQALMPLHSNLLHMLTLRDGSKVPNSRIKFINETRKIRNFSELAGLRVAVVGSARLVGEKLNRSTDSDMELLEAEDDDQALTWLRSNKVQAIFTTGGWPMPNIARHKRESGLVLVEYDQKLPAPFVMVKRNYQNLDAFNFSFVSTSNLLLTRPFKSTGDMARKMGTLQSCLLRNLDNLQEGRFSAAWKEIKSPTDTLGVARFTRPEGHKTSRIASYQQ